MKIIFGVLLLAVATIAASSQDLKFLDILLNKISPPVPGIESRIIGGENVASNVAPYIVSLSISKVAYAHGYAGIIIGREWVLTAAHAINELESFAGDVIGLPVYAGLQDRSQLQDSQVRHIDFAFKHKEFTGQIGSPDIGLLHVKPSFTFNARVQQIYLPIKNEQFTGDLAATFGWGLEDREGNKYSNKLNVAKGEVLNSTECAKNLPDGAGVSKNEICTNVVACLGDGGSPLVKQFGGGAPDELIGCASWGYVPCGYKDRPTVYTAVSAYVDWISEVQWAYYILN